MDWSDGNTVGSGDEPIDARERHMLAELERQKSMRDLFLSLHSLLPQPNSVRKEQSSILDEIIKYIPLAESRLRSLKNRTDAPSSPTTAFLHSENSTDCDIKVAPEPSSSVAIRVRGDLVNVSLTDTKGTSQTLLLSSVFDELEAHHLELVRSTNCHDGTKILHHSECRICDGLDRSPALLKEKLQELACRLHKLRKSSSFKRSFQQID